MNLPTRPIRPVPPGLLPALAVLILCYAIPLCRLARLALGSDFYSYILVIPAISVALAWLREPLPPQSLPSPPARGVAAVLLAAGIALAAVAGIAAAAGRGGPPPDLLALAALSFALLFSGLCGWFLGRRTFRSLAFPLAFLALLAPLPLSVSVALEGFLQHSSAAVASLLFDWAGMPVLNRGDLGFQLPGMNLEVAPQCSGLRSTLSLFITSLPAGFLFLRSPWRRAALSLATLPVGIIRNGFRILTIGELCVRVGPRMIDSYIHRSGGWIFFILSLAPLVVLLLLLMRAERAAPPPGAKPATP
jgi:exosortase C (VPDSG-CTERM-specific)